MFSTLLSVWYNTVHVPFVYLGIMQCKNLFEVPLLAFKSSMIHPVVKANVTRCIAARQTGLLHFVVRNVFAFRSSLYHVLLADAGSVTIL